MLATSKHANYLCSRLMQMKNYCSNFVANSFQDPHGEPLVN